MISQTLTICLSCGQKTPRQLESGFLECVGPQEIPAIAQISNKQKSQMAVPKGMPDCHAIRVCRPCPLWLAPQKRS